MLENIEGVNWGMDQRERMIEQLYNEKETAILHFQELEIEVDALECERRSYIKRLERLPYEAGAHLFWIFMIALGLYILLGMNSGVFSIAKVGYIVLLPIIIKYIISSVKKFYEWVINIDCPYMNARALQRSEKTVRIRIAELNSEIEVKKKIMLEYEAQKLELIRRLNEVSNNANVWRM